LLKIILRFFAVILLTVFVIAFPLSLVLRDVGSLLFNPATAKVLVKENLMNSELVSSFVFQASRQMFQGSDDEKSGAQLVLAHLSEDDWNQITKLIAPKELVDQSVDQVVDAFTAWLNTQAAFPDVQISLLAWKENALKNSGDVVSLILNALPSCDSETLASMSITEDLDQLAEAIPLCLPPEPLYGEIVRRADLVMTQMLGNAPDTIDLGQLNQGQAPAELTQLKQNLVSMRTFLNWSWVFVAAIGVVGVVMGANGTVSHLRWSGWTLALAGFIVLIFGFGLQVFSLNFLDQFLATVLEQGPGAMGSLGTAIASGALNLITRPLLLQGLVISALGISALIYSRNLARNAASPGIPINRRKIGL